MKKYCMTIVLWNTSKDERFNLGILHQHLLPYAQRHGLAFHIRQGARNLPAGVTAQLNSHPAK